MSGPWENYAAVPAATSGASDGPWAKYSAAPEPPAATSTVVPEHEFKAQVHHLLATGASAKDIHAYVTGAGYADTPDIDKATEWTAAHPGRAQEIPIKTTVADSGESVSVGKPDTLSGLEPEQIKAHFDAMPSMGRPGFQDVVTHGITLGLDTEAAGLADAAGNAIAHPIKAFETGGGSVADAYHRGRQESLARIDYANEANPVLSTAGEIGGSLLNPIGAGATTLKGLVGAGAVAGGIHGFEEGDKSLGGRLATGAGEGAVSGVAAGTLGGLLGAGSRVVAKGVDAGSRLLGRDASVGARLVAQKLSDDAIKPAEAGTALQEARRLGTPAVIADLGDNVRALGGSVSRQAGPARSIAKSVTTDRQLGQGERIKDAINRDLGPTTDVLEESNRLMKGAREAAGPLYEKAYAAPAVGSPELDSLLATPAGRQALARAHTIAGNERRDPKTLGFSLDDSGNVALNPVNVGAHGNLASARSELDAAQAEMDRLRRLSQGGTYVGDAKGVRARLEAAQAGFDKAQQGYAGLPTTGVASTQPVYSPQTLDYVKRGIDDVIEGLPKAPTGKPIMDENYRAVDGVRRQLLTELDKLNPAYGKARAAYAGPASMRSAMMEGKSALQKSASEINQRVSNMSDAERQQFALGLRSAIADQLDAGGDSANKVRQVVGNPKKRAALARVFGDTGKLDDFFATLGNEQAAFHTYHSVNSGSQTAERSAEDSANSDLKLFQQFGDAANAAQGGVAGLAGYGLSRLSDLVKYGAGAAGKRAREDASALLFSSDPMEFKNAMAEVSRTDELSGLRRKRLQDFLSKTGGRLGSVGSIATVNGIQRANGR